MNLHCEGCSILKQNKPIHTVLDYEKMEEVDILFLSDSIKWNYGETRAFREEEEFLIIECLRPYYKNINEGLKIDFAAAVKCPGVLETDMSPKDMNLCRQHLRDTIEKLKPKLVFTCGNLAMKMLIKKSGIGGRRGKRGSFFSYKQDDFECTVVPIFHPFAVIQEPKNRYLFELDIRNGINKYIFKDTDKTQFSYTGIFEESQFKDYEFLFSTTEPISVDIETTGLDFTRDIIQTIAISYSSDNICIPIDHKHSPFQGVDREKAIAFIKKILENESNRKILQNASFDRKFLRRYGIELANVWDTKVLAKLIREDAPNDLKNLTKEYFSEELEDL